MIACKIKTHLFSMHYKNQKLHDDQQAKMYPSTIIIWIMLIILSNIIQGECGSTHGVTGFYVFGDSSLDSGNNNWIETIAKCNYPPYGHNFSQGATGRFINGKTVADYAADYLGLPYPPPYKGLLFQPISLTGYNYASGSCGILPQTGQQYGPCLTLDKQMTLFEETVKTLSRSKSQNEVSQHLAKSIFLLAVGSNDYIENYSDPNHRHEHNAEQFAKLLIRSLSLQLQKMYKLGARKVLVSNIGAIGCAPAIIRLSNLEGKCNEHLNKIVSMYNNQLPSMLDDLTSTLKDSHFVLIDSYTFSYDAMTNPTKYGLTNANSSCCVTLGDVVPSLSLCLIGEHPPCRDPDSHFFWDEIHPSQAAYSLSFYRFVDGYAHGVLFQLEKLALL